MLTNQKTVVYETGAEPEFNIHDLARYEDAGDGLIRLYFASQRGQNSRIEYSVLITPPTLARICRECLMIAADMHNLLIWQEELKAN